MSTDSAPADRSPRLPEGRSSHCRNVCDYALYVGVWPVQSCDGECYALRHRVNEKAREVSP